MLITVAQITKIMKLRPSGVLHVGAHLAEERQAYIENKWGNTLWIDAVDQNVQYVKKLIAGSEDWCIQALVWSDSGIDLGFNISSNSL